MEPLLKVENLHIAFRGIAGLTHVVQGVNLLVKEGEVQGIVGRSGSGKSVLARAILGLLEESAEVTRGKVIFGGQDVYSMDAQSRRAIRGKRMGYIAQSGRSALNPLLPVGTQLANVYLAHHPGCTRQVANREAVKSLTSVGINDAERRIKAYPHELSGGMAQRVLIAAALINDPELIVADDPTGGLDVTIQAQILALIRDLVRTRKMAMLLISRDLGVIAHMADRIAVMNDGVIVENRTREGVLRNPEHAETRSLLDAFSSYAEGTESMPVDHQPMQG